MKSFLFLAIALLQAVDPAQQGPATDTAPSAPPPAVPIPEELPDSAPQVPPYEGQFSEGMRELRTRARAGELDEALALADRLLAREWAGSLRTRAERATGGWSERALTSLEAPLDWLGMELRTSADRAEIHYARGVVLHELARHAEARESFGQARVLAGPGQTRLDAVYDLGTSALVEGEQWRAQIPEIAGAPPPPAAPGTQAPALASPAPEDDPLMRARAAYLEAREHLIERLRADWRDEDARANVELALRRLRELDEIEHRRREQQDQQQEQQQQQQQESQPGEQDGEPKPQEDPPEPQEKPEQPEQPQDEPADAGESPPEPSEGEEPAAEPEERELTKEEVQRLLDRLSEHEEEGEQVRAQLKRLRRVPVKRDW